MSHLPFKIAGLGVPAGGTGILLRLLESHPAVATPIRSSAVLSKAAVSVEEMNTLSQSVNRATAGLTGVYLTDTFGQPHCARLINQYLPEARLLLVVRNPLDCLVATYEVAKERGQTKVGESCAEFIARQPKLQTAVLYSDTLSDLYSYYGATSLYVVLYDDLRDQPVKTMQQVFTFLEIDDTFVPPAIAHYIPKPESIGRPAWWRRLGAWMLRPLLQRLKRKPAPVVPSPFNLDDYFSITERESLLAWYRPDMVTLSTLLHKDMVAKWGS